MPLSAIASKHWSFCLSMCPHYQSPAVTEPHLGHLCPCLGFPRLTETPACSLPLRQACDYCLPAEDGMEKPLCCGLESPRLVLHYKEG